MAPSVVSKVLSGSALLAAVSAQNFGGGSGRGEGAFNYVQPLNTTILTEYGSSPAVYPSPKTSGAGGWEMGLEKAKAFVAQLTLEEKADMVTGQAGPCVGNIVAIPRLGFPGLCLHDGPLAIRVADYASVFSAGVSAGATWDKDLMYERGYAMGEEFRAKGAHVFLGPVAGPLGRSAYAGRNWEGFSSDPYLSGVAMEKTILASQDAGVQACPKHWIGNEQEIMRNPTYRTDDNTEQKQAAISSNIDDRTMHELYMWPFANAIKARAASVMCSYQRINGSYGCQNSASQNGLLKGELGFQGYIMSDWGATHSGVASIEAGLDMNMPGGLGSYGMNFGVPSYFGGNVTLAVNNGTINESRIDDMVLRIMTPYFQLGQDNGYPSVDPSSADLNTFSPRNTWTREFNLTGEKSRDVRGNHAELIRRHGAAGTVLLKNVDRTLPLKAPRNVAVFGNGAGEPARSSVLNQQNYEYGAIFAGGGSGTGQNTYVITPLSAIQQRVREDRGIVQYFLNNTHIINNNVSTLVIPRDVPDVCIVMLKTWAEEGDDRYHLGSDWNGDEVVESVAAFCNNTVVVTYSSGINTLPWSDHPNVTAILAAHFPGEESGNSLVDILYGDVNPSGHLPYTIAKNGDDWNAPPTTEIQTDGFNDWQSWFNEKLEIDYRHFDMHNMSVRYEFGFGLSYTTFSISNIKSAPLKEAITSKPEDLPIQPGGNPALWESIYNVTVSVANTGDVAGAAVPQLYVGLPSSAPAGTPVRQLRGFEKVYLEKGETQSVSFELMRRDLSYWDVVSQQWVIPEGEFNIWVGLSSRDLKVHDSFTVVGQ
ncbi:glycoside hydrolase family 3 protein [Bipolaris maydis ATCC 48331]|uniref:Probable beta-glucosidase G n=3 Tax=Cochliobolus heterostrophus TaxID=5016 RepID=M2UJK9_COCH5|nr:glycoside hydrolase family 3 protein [Bipolaris maydis ATCC 48331]EMD88183.1 glycoside hydrolase family 3 protein [Bipolaris maydis C5]ENI02238.1 glycoside hydrolase family 3 protein [Bipolaris maydis ATCC 48331]KAJ5057835.1 glycoside hydrolase superfamily [Bipolaris maydis]KAJ6207149.1 glycoside hydrolase family 3 protein [Bipolaris maydis]